MRELLLVPTALEARALVAELPREREAIPLAEDRWLAICGFGLAAAGAVAARQIARLAPERIGLCGIAGSHDLDRAPVGSLVGGDRVRSWGIGAGQGGAHLDAETIGIPEAPGLAFELALDPVPGMPAASIVSVAAASGDAEEARLLRTRRPGVVVEDMETWAVALAAADAGIPLRVLRAISNAAGDRDQAHWRIGAALAALRRALPRLFA